MSHCSFTLSYMFGWQRYFVVLKERLNGIGVYIYNITNKLTNLEVFLWCWQLPLSNCRGKIPDHNTHINIGQTTWISILVRSIQLDE